MRVTKSGYRSNAGAELANRVQYDQARKPREQAPLFNEVPRRKHVTPGRAEDARHLSASKLYPKREVDHYARGAGSPLGTGQAKRVMSQAEKEDAQRWNERARKLRRG
jgi:hypothetical protein